MLALDTGDEWRMFQTGQFKYKCVLSVCVTKERMTGIKCLAVHKSKWKMDRVGEG